MATQAGLAQTSRTVPPLGTEKAKMPLTEARVSAWLDKVNATHADPHKTHWTTYAKSMLAELFGAAE